MRESVGYEINLLSKLKTSIVSQQPKRIHFSIYINQMCQNWWYHLICYIWLLSDQSDCQCSNECFSNLLWISLRFTRKSKSNLIFVFEYHLVAFKLSLFLFVIQQKKKPEFLTRFSHSSKPQLLSIQHRMERMISYSFNINHDRLEIKSATTSRTNR